MIPPEPYASIPLPSDWPESVRESMLQVVALAHRAITITRSWWADSSLRLSGMSI